MFVARHSSSPWGDSGDILVHGMSLNLDRKDGRIQLQRTGPFVPPISLPGLHDLIVTDPVRRALASTLPELVFRPVVKARIVRLEWERWDLSADEPPEVPSTGEPEDYVLERPHDEALAEAMGPLFELVPEVVPEIQRHGELVAEAYRGQDFVCADPMVGYGYLSPRLAEALARLADRWVTFVRAR